MVQTVLEAFENTPPAVSTLTVTGLSSLANGSSSTSNAIDNHTTLDPEILCNLSITQVSAVAGYVEVYASGSLDNSTFPPSGQDKLLGYATIFTDGSATAFNISFPLSPAWQGFLYPYIKLRVNNQSGANFNAGTLTYNGSKFTVG